VVRASPWSDMCATCRNPAPKPIDIEAGFVPHYEIVRKKLEIIDAIAKDAAKPMKSSWQPTHETAKAKL